jgi:hypothetical protein
LIACHYFTLFPAYDARYASIAGGLNPEQPALIAKVREELAVVCITHPDKDGDYFASVIREAAGSLPFSIHRPETVKDWNDELRRLEVPLHSFPAVL